MEFQLISIGKNSSPWLHQPLQDYEKRIKRFVNFSQLTIPDIKNAGKISEEQQKKEEGKIILKNIGEKDYVVLLDEKGKEKTSREFSEWIAALLNNSFKRVNFVIGGPYGFSKEVYERADFKISLSKMTFTHEMVRLFFIEQIYRSFSIIHGLPYHHD